MRNQVFLSHAHEDKDLVGQVAEELRLVFGQDKIFYDSWSMKPGESLVGKMTEGLGNCAFFFLFMSEVSLKKPMVRLEWHNGLIASLKDNSSFIPVRIDNISPPAILTTTLYLDMYNRGLPQTIDDIKSIINGNGLYKPSQLKLFNNFEIQLKKFNGRGLTIVINARKLTEPVNRFAFWLSDGNEVGAYGMSTLGTARVSFGGVPKEVKIIEQTRTITPGNPQEFHIANPSDNFQIEIYHLPTQESVTSIFSANINMSML